MILKAHGFSGSQMWSNRFYWLKSWSGCWSAHRSGTRYKSWIWSLSNSMSYSWSWSRSMVWSSSWSDTKPESWSRSCLMSRNWSENI